MACQICQRDIDSSRRRYCSDACALEGRRQNKNRSSRDRGKRARQQALEEKRVCGCCGRSYIRRDGFVKYCSVDCRKRAGSAAGNSKRRASLAAVPSWPISFAEVFERDGGHCSLCGIETPLHLRGAHVDDAPELDHIIPISRGGHDAEYNIQLTCRKCNLAKGNRIYAKDRAKARLLWPEQPVIMSVKSRPTSRNSSGVKGVFFDKLSGRWVAQLERDGVRQRSTYETRAEAIAARKMMEASDASAKKSSIVARYFSTR
jgi:hypothetical protein